MTNDAGKPIFSDESGRRWNRIRSVGVWAALLVSIVGALFSISVLLVPASSISLRSRIYSHGPVIRIESKTEAARRFIARRTRDALVKSIAAEKPHAGANSGPRSTVVGFYVNWEDASYESLRRHIGSLTYVMPEWLYLTPDGSGVETREDDKRTHDGNVRRVCAQHGVPLIAMLDNIDKTSRSFDWARLRSLLSDDDAQRSLIDDLRRTLLSSHLAGVNLDFEPGVLLDDLSPSDARLCRRLMHDRYPAFIQRVTDALHKDHLLVTVDVGVDTEQFDYGAIGRACDFMVVMLYDQHAAAGVPGPIASQEWVEECAESIFRDVDSSKVVLGVGNYCYDWPVLRAKDGSILEDSSGDIRPNGQGRKYTLGPALSIADAAGADVQMDDSDLNPYFTYDDNQGAAHIVYILDAVTAYNEVQALKGYRPRGAALWYLGSEDPSIWSFLDKSRLGRRISSSALGRVSFEDEMSGEPNGRGEVIQVTEVAKPGVRRLTANEDGLYVSEDYAQYPSPFILDRFGDAKDAVALTFDDGPDPEWTPQILRILRKYHAPATFFVVGRSAERYPAIVGDAWNSGCEIGNHTFTHPHMMTVSPLRAQLEANATQRVIESVIGRSTRLFRPPFAEGSDADPNDMSEAPLLLELQGLGYVTVGMNIDPSDYEAPPVKTIVSRVLSQLTTTDYDGKRVQNHIVLLHDGGGDRSHTVEALPLIIQSLRARGLKLCTVTDLLGPGARERLFPAVQDRQGAIAGLDRWIFEGGFAMSSGLRLIFLTMIVLGILRFIFVGLLALLQAARARRAEYPEYSPFVAVMIAAYNEEAVIGRTIASALRSDYPGLRVIVVDDGSTDGTANEVERLYGSDPRVRLLRKENGGKSSALNLAISECEAEIVVCVDADTVIMPDAVSKLVRHFSDPGVGAVAGNVKVGNRSNALTIWQSVEYITGQNFDRRAYAALGAVPVAPGAISAWRRSVVSEVGGYGADTLAEDTDLTFRVILAGYKTVTENEAIALTESPDTVSALAKQRFRWAFGTLQCLWKHRRLLFRTRHGAFTMFVMPAMWIYAIGFQALSPIVDIAVIASLLSHEALAVFSYYALFFVIDLLGSALAFRLDRENTKSLVWLFWQRFFYRQFMYFVVIKSIVAALRGGLVGWGKLHRKGTVVVSD